MKPNRGPQFQPAQFFHVERLSLKCCNYSVLIVIDLSTLDACTYRHLSVPEKQRLQPFRHLICGFDFKFFVIASTMRNPEVLRCRI